MLYVNCHIFEYYCYNSELHESIFSFKLTILSLLLWADIVLQLYLPYLKVCVWFLYNNAVDVKGKCLLNQMMLRIICILFIMSYPELRVSSILYYFLSVKKNLVADHTLLSLPM